MAAVRGLLPAAALLLALALVAAGPAPAARPADTAEVPGDAQGKNAPGATTSNTGSEVVTPETGSGDTEGGGGTGLGKTDEPESKFYAQNNLSRIFFNYGAAVTAIVYGLMGVGYFYGPYSKAALEAKRRSEMRLQLLKHQLGGDEEPEEDYGSFLREEAGVLGEYGPQPVPYQTARSGAAPAADPTGDYQLVMARSEPAGVNRRGEPAAIPIRLQPDGTGSSGAGGGAPVVNVLDMESSECQAWIDCLQRRSERMLLEPVDMSPTEFDPSCEQFYFTCPTNARSLDELVGQ